MLLFSTGASRLNDGIECLQYHESGRYRRTTIAVVCTSASTILTTLNKYRIGQSGIVSSIAPGDLAPKLVEMGLYAGQQVMVLYRAPLGDPIAVDIGGYVLSLRLDEAHSVRMEPATP